MMRLPCRPLALAFALLLALGACGNDPEREGTFAVAQSAIATVTGPLLGGADAPQQAASTPQEIAGILAQLPPGPVLRFDVPKVGQSAIAFVARRNQGFITFATATGQTVTTRSGIVTATRGFSWDLMSSAPNRATDVIRGRGRGEVQRIYRFLDASDDEIELVASCAIAPSGSETITVASGARHAATRMTETCRAGDLAFTNLYWVTSGGLIVRSHQWISDEVGELRIDLLRN